MSIASNYEKEKADLAAQCERVGRNPEDVLLLAVSKTVGLDGVKCAISAGAHDFGENRPDQIMEKHAAYPSENWHFIGNIQSRRIKDIVSCSTLIHSLYEERHAEKINSVAAAMKKIQDVLVEVNVSGEKSKSGLTPDDAERFVSDVSKLSNVCVIGLMTMAPQGDLALAKECFSDLRLLRDSIRKSLPQHSRESFFHLSMGMSEDWREAVAEGSTIVRIGRAIFSDNFA